MPDMPMPPMPTKWMGPISFGSFMPAVSRAGRETGPDSRAGRNRRVRPIWELGPPALRCNLRTGATRS